MRSFFVKISLMLGGLSLGVACSQKTTFVEKRQIQLAAPIINSAGVFFTKDLDVEIALDLEDRQIRYTLDGSEPTLNSKIYNGDLQISKSAMIKTRAFHPDYLASETSTTQFVKIKPTNPIKNVITNRTPHENYPGLGAKGLIDYVKGTKDFRSEAWLGYSGGSLEITLETKKMERVERVIVSLLSDQKSWIFFPESIEVFMMNEGEEDTFITKKNIEVTEEDSASEFRFATIEFQPQKSDFIKIKLNCLEGIPSWHSGKGTLPWLFLDEILVE